MRAPAFWSIDGPLARLLSPFGAVYGAATRRRLRRQGVRLSIPVLCVGNLTAGGTGKTPVVIALIEALAARSSPDLRLDLRPGLHADVHIVSRGYGGRLKGPVRVDPTRHSAEEVGDEPLLLSAFAPVWVARDRAAAGRAAEAAGAEALILDDGFQNPSLVKDLSLVVVDAETGFGNGRCIPAGPLREPVAVGLGRADFLLILGPAAARAGFRARTALPDGLPVLEGEIVPRDTGMAWEGRRVVAFAGIGRPEKFFATLRGLGADLVGAHALADHQPIGRQLMARLEREARDKRAMLVTTDKDAVRLPRALHGTAIPVPVTLRLEDPDRLEQILGKVFAFKLPG
ncbi:MAG: tetraacyldisaccharide 4'-kinase [Pseudomonadota bacterium]